VNKEHKIATRNNRRNKVNKKMLTLLFVCVWISLNASDFLCLKENIPQKQESLILDKGQLILSSVQRETEFTITEGQTVVYQGNQGEISLDEGTYQVKAYNRFFISQTKSVSVKKGKKALLSFDLAVYEKETIHNVEKYQYRTWAGLALTAANILFIINADKKGDDAYQNYQDTAISAMALDYKSDVKKWDKYQLISSISLTLPVYFTISSYRNFLKNKAILKEKV